ncbi:hypothetical protein F2Q69_00006005 [Brassica cretica]|uniref:Uncharacterized protein n=1 Tax=Brassica cretica TaxID=69181 RepID=A0A8S9PDR0_BRACR|nr:hypothetical protein F2Q69_00006005 [Brassica cretica]
MILPRMMRRNTKSPFPEIEYCVVLVMTLSLKSGLSTGLSLILKLCGIIGCPIMFLSDCWSTGSRYLKLDHGRRASLT